MRNKIEQIISLFFHYLIKFFFRKIITFSVISLGTHRPITHAPLKQTSRPSKPVQRPPTLTFDTQCGVTRVSQKRYGEPQVGASRLQPGRGANRYICSVYKFDKPEMTFPSGVQKSDYH